MRQSEGRKRATTAVREPGAARAWRRALLGLGLGVGLAAQAGAAAGGPADAPSSAPEKRVVTPPAPLPQDRPASVPTVSQAPEKVVENSYLDGPLLYQLLLAEFNRSEGQPGDAIELMLDAARRNKDDALFRRSLEIAVEAGAGDKALAITKAWRQTLPKSTDAVRTQVQLLFALDRVADAGEPLRQLLAMSSPGERAALIAGLPRAAQRAQDKAAATEQFKQVLAPYLDAPDTRTSARVALARMELAEGKTAEALALARSAQAQDPKAPGPVLLALDVMNGPSSPADAAPDGGGKAASPSPSPATTGPNVDAAKNAQDAEAIIRTYLADPQAEPLIRQAYASVLVSQQRLTDAADQLRQAAKLRPKQAQLWLGLGEIELELHHPDEAEAALTKALALVSPPQGGGASAPAPGASEDDSAPDASDASGPSDQAEPMSGTVRLAHIQLLLARAAEMRHDDATAAQWLARVDAKDADLQVIALRASLLARQGKLSEARAMVRAAPAGTPAEQRYRLLTEVQLLLDNKKYEDARVLLSKANAEQPDDVDLIYQEAMVNERLNRLDEMERLLRRIIVLQPNNSQALNALGYSLADRNLRLEEALGLVQQAHALSPTDPFIVDSLGWVLFRMGRYDEAASFLNQAYASRKDTEIAAHLGEALWANGKRDEAVQVLRDAHRRDATNEVLKQTMARLKVSP
jgi:tetratricopeptide (TPR) repeat protein